MKKSLSDRIEVLEEKVKELEDAHVDLSESVIDLERFRQGLKGGKQSTCKSFLMSVLDEGPCPISDVRKLCIEHGYGIHLTNRAKQELGIKAYNEKGVWYWEL